MIYHYTNDENLLRIQNNKMLSLTKSTSSNDLRDTIYLSELLETNANSIFTEILSTNVFEGNLSNNVLEGFVEMVSTIYKNLNDDLVNVNTSKAKTNKCFVICFTRKKDSRFLWEAYTLDNGVNLGIDITEYSRFLSENYLDVADRKMNMRFEKVIYSEKEQLKILRKISKKAFKNNYHDIDKLSDSSNTFEHVINFVDDDNTLMSSHKSEPVRITIKQWVLNFMNEYVRELLIVAPYIKHPYWKEEEEYRLCIYRPQVGEKLSEICQFKRKNTGEIVDYIEVPFPYTQIKKVTIGPLSKFLSSNEYKKVNLFNEVKTILKSTGVGVKKKY